MGAAVLWGWENPNLFLQQARWRHLLHPMPMGLAQSPEAPVPMGHYLWMGMLQVCARI